MHESEGAVNSETKPAKQLTSYKVYKVHEDYTLELLGPEDGANDIQAISKLVGETEGKYVAIPARSLRVRTVAAVSVPKVTIT